MALRVARHRSHSYPTGKAAFQLAGGPGGSSVVQSGIVPRFFSDLRDTFDLVYVDQRGTGGSGYLGCAAGYPYAKGEWIACANEHDEKPLDHYMTLNAARDLDFVRERMGHEKIYIRGGSYGTRLALEYMRQFEAHLAAVVLDGLAPSDFDFTSYGITQTDRGIALLIVECNASPQCLEVSPQLEEDLVAWRQKISESPRPILVDGSPYFEDEELFLMVLPSMFDWVDVRYQMPRAIHQAILGDTALWNYLLSMMFGMTIRDVTGENWLKSAPTKARPLRLPMRPEWRGQSYVAPGLHAAISCAEWIPNSTWEQAVALCEQQTWDDGYFLDYFAACEYWNVTPLSPELRQPVISSVKTLLLSGAIDIVTPTEEGDRAVQTLANGTHLVVPHMTHSTMSVPCVADIITEFFWADGDMTGIDTSCLADLGHPAW
ncbi:alpha/beta fold hydrolase [Myxococcota bacterium]